MDRHRLLNLDTRLDKLGLRGQGENLCTAEAFRARLDIGWIYHDNALEGVVLSYPEIKDALVRKTSLLSNRNAIAAGICEHKAAIDFVTELGYAESHHGHRRGLVTVALLNKLHAILTPADKAQGSPYRKERIPHRNYHHAIARPDQISLRMHKLCARLDDEPGSMHPLVGAAGVHYEIMAIYPWARNSGRVARLLMNLLLLRDGYPPAVIPGIERQRYYASLYAENDCLANLVAETLDAYCDTVTQFLDRLQRT